MRARRFSFKKSKVTRTTRTKLYYFVSFLLLSLYLYRNNGNSNTSARKSVILFPSLTGTTTGCEYPVETDTVVKSRKIVEKEGAKLSLIALTHSRAASLTRLVKSLREADYDGDAVELHIWIDRYKNGSVHTETVTTASQLEWPHGASAVHVWDRHVGIWGQWVDSCRGSGRCLILEDDLQVSPQYYRWLSKANEAYGGREDVFGYTLQRGTLRANRTGFGRRPLDIPASAETFMYPLLGSWGYAPTPLHWASFREWFHTHACDRDFHPYVDELVPTLWYKKQERKRTMWTMWHIRYAHDNKLYTVYANMPDKTTLAASWREPGLHFRAPKNTSDTKDSTKLAGSMDFDLLQADKPLPQLPYNPLKLNWNGVAE